MTIYVCPLSIAPRMAKLNNVSHVVSLLDPSSPFPLIKEVGERHLCIEAHDIEDAQEGMDPLCELRTKRILEFVGGWDRTRPILIHCYAGISRSTATAFITACAQNPSADEEEIALALREASTNASPNRRFVAMADAELGRSGRMTRAIERIGRGASWYDIGENTPFSMPSRY